MKRLSDETEPVIKRACFFVSSSPIPSIISLDSQNEQDDDIIEIVHTCQHSDNTIIIISDDDEDQNDTSLSSIINILIPSSHNEDVEIIEENVNIENNHELIDLTDDESTSICCLSNKLERKSSIDVQKCPICLETLSDLQYTGVYLLITPCHHIMCTLCSHQLLATSSRCPICRENISLTTLMPYCILI